SRALGTAFKETWVTGMAKTLSDKWFLGGLCVGSAYFFGVDVTELTFENFKGRIFELLEAQPETPANPQSYDV
ncbi:MAG: hypothetical protein AAFP28_03835, partial [Pseudomonadota bacterium]